MERHCKSLELDKILKILADKTSCEEAREAALNLKPEYKLEKAERNLKMTDDAYVLTGKYGAPTFGNHEKRRE